MHSSVAGWYSTTHCWKCLRRPSRTTPNQPGALDVPKPLNGLDVSHHQKPSSINWKARPADLTFAYVRALYGTKLDVACEEHCRNARRAGLDVGLYSFVRDDHTIDAQWEAIQAAVEEHAHSESPCMALDAEWQY